jgi:hypothetical protein
MIALNRYSDKVSRGEHYLDELQKQLEAMQSDLILYHGVENKN